MKQNQKVKQCSVFSILVFYNRFTKKADKQI